MSDVKSSAESTVSKAPDSKPTSTAPDLDWKTRAAISVAGFIVRMLVRTWRFRVEGRERCEQGRVPGKGMIFTLWHGQMLPLLGEHKRPTTILISDHRDGEIITQITRSLGCRAVRGSSSKGAARALLQLSRVLNEGNDIAITPDGPRGPFHSFAPGALALSQRTGAPIVLLGSHTSRMWQLKSWDRFEIPKPFARITVAYGDPFVVSAEGARDAATDTVVVSKQLLGLNERAVALAGGLPTEFQ